MSTATGGVAPARPPAIALMGPTASGKTDLALAWAERWPLGLVSVDSALVYRGLDIGSAKPDAATLARVPHRLVDVCDPHEPYSAARFASDALAAMQEITAQGRIPLLVGGTGLYFHALLHGLSDIPESDPALRAALADEAAERGWPWMHQELARVDPPAAARIRPGDRQRILRALEVQRQTGRPISAWQQGGRPQRLAFRVLKLIVAPDDRALLHQRIARRFDAMLAGGFLAEVERLRRDPRLHPDLPSMRAVGYRQAWRHLAGETDAVAFREQAIAATRQLAKRQFTWLRRELDARWFDPSRAGGEPGRAIEAFLG